MENIFVKGNKVYYAIKHDRNELDPLGRKVRYPEEYYSETGCICEEYTAEELRELIKKEIESISYCRNGMRCAESENEKDYYMYDGDIHEEYLAKYQRMLEVICPDTNSYHLKTEHEKYDYGIDIISVYRNEETEPILTFDMCDKYIRNDMLQHDIDRIFYMYKPNPKLKDIIQSQLFAMYGLKEEDEVPFRFL